MLILPVSLKLVQFEVSTLKSEEVHILEFSGEYKSPLTFLVERSEIFLLQTSKVEGCNAKGVHQFVMPLDANKYTYMAFYLSAFISLDALASVRHFPKSLLLCSSS